MKNIRKRFGEFLGVISIIGLFLYIEYGKEVGIYLILLLPTAIASLYLTFYEYIVSYRQHIEYEYSDYHAHDIIHAARKCKRAIYAISISFILTFLFTYIYISLDMDLSSYNNHIVCYPHNCTLFLYYKLSSYRWRLYCLHARTFLKCLACVFVTVVGASAHNCLVRCLNGKRPTH